MIRSHAVGMECCRVQWRRGDAMQTLGVGVSQTDETQPVTRQQRASGNHQSVRLRLAECVDSRDRSGKLPAIQTVFLEQLTEGTTFLARQTGRARNIAARLLHDRSQIVLFEPLYCT